jgi:hypothetical protein
VIDIDRSPPQVISVRLLLQDTLFEVDPEGIAFARMVNAHLPASVRVLSVQVGPLREGRDGWARCSSAASGSRIRFGTGVVG